MGRRTGRVEPPPTHLMALSCRYHGTAWTRWLPSHLSAGLTAAAAALCFCLSFTALPCASKFSGSQTLHVSHGESLMYNVNPSFRRFCWHRWWLSLRRRKYDHPGNFSWASCKEERSRNSAILPNLTGGKWLHTKVGIKTFSRSNTASKSAQLWDRLTK